MDVRGKKKEKAVLIKTEATFRSLLLCFCIVFVCGTYPIARWSRATAECLDKNVLSDCCGSANQDYK